MWIFLLLWIGLTSGFEIQPGADQWITFTSVEKTTAQRRYILHTPPSYKPDVPLPLVIDVHPYTGSPSGEEGQSGMKQLADSNGFIVAYPEGGGPPLRGFSGSPENVQPGCCGLPSTQKWNDVQFIVDVKYDVMKHVSVNKSAVYLMGFSNGAYMIHKVACHKPEEFAAFAGTSAGLSVGMAACKPSKMRPMWYDNGIHDTTQPINGARVAGEQMIGLNKTILEYTRRNKCTGPQAGTETFHKGTTVCYRNAGCPVGLDVNWCKVNSGHVTYSNRDLNQAHVWWEFFKKFTV